MMLFYLRVPEPHEGCMREVELNVCVQMYTHTSGLIELELEPVRQV